MLLKNCSLPATSAKTHGCYCSHSRVKARRRWLSPRWRCKTLGARGSAAVRCCRDPRRCISLPVGFYPMYAIQICSRRGFWEFFCWLYKKKGGIGPANQTCLDDFCSQWARSSSGFARFSHHAWGVGHMQRVLSPSLIQTGTKSSWGY